MITRYWRANYGGRDVDARNHWRDRVTLLPIAQPKSIIYFPHTLSFYASITFPLQFSSLLPYTLPILLYLQTPPLMYTPHSPPPSGPPSTASPPVGLVDRKPNILFILADQVSAPLLRIHNESSPVKTPHIDALAAKSAVFTSAYCASPLCAPSRSSLVTGLLPTKIGAWDNASPLGVDVPTYAHYLRREGYETVLAGKMHFIGEQLHGYEERLTSDIYPGDFGWYV